jgi:hypothetical protein
LRLRLVANVITLSRYTQSTSFKKQGNGSFNVKSIRKQQNH